VKVIKPRRIRRAGHVARIREKIGAYRGFVRKPDGQRSPGRPRSIILKWICENGLD
jgi:hypothetical protein